MNPVRTQPNQPSKTGNGFARWQRGLIRICGAVIAGVIALTGVNVQAATTTWSGSSSSSLTTSGNWVGGTVPGTNDIATFNSSPTRQPSLSGSVQIGELLFTATGGTPITLSSTGSSVLTLSGTPGSGVVNSGNQTNTVSPVISISNNQTWANTNSTGGNLVFNGTTLTLGTFSLTLSNAAANSSITIANSIQGTGGIITTGSGTTVLTNASNSYSGNTLVQGGSTLEVYSLTNGGANSGIGRSSSAASSLVLNGGTLKYSGATATTNRLFTIGVNGTTLNASGTGSVTFSNTSSTVLDSTSGSHTLTLAGTGTATFAGTIAGTATQGLSLVKTDSGTFNLTKTNSSYTGSTSILGGTLAVNTLANGGSNSGIGASGSAASNLVLGGGTLQYTGAAVTSNRLFTLNVGTSTISNTGTGALTLNNTGAIATSGSGNRTLVIDGTNTTSINGVIADGTGGVTSVSKTGSGVGILGGANTYTGTTSVQVGTLRLGAAGSVSTLSSLDISSGGTLDLNSRATTVVSLTGAGAILTGTSAGTLTVNNSIANSFTGTISGAGGLVKTGSATLSLSGANTYTGGTTINGGTLAVSTLANGGSTSGIGASASTADNLRINGGTLQYTGATTTTNRLFKIGTSATLSNNGTGTVSFTNTGSVAFNTTTQSATTLILAGTNTGSNTLAAKLTDVSATAATSILKQDAGTWVVTNSNSYSGGTIAVAGTLGVGANQALGTGFVSLAAGATLRADASTISMANTVNIGASNTGVLDNNGHALTIAGTITGAGSLVVMGSGTTSFTGTNSSFSGGTTLSGSTLIVNNNAALGTGTLTSSGNSTLSNAASTLSLSNNLNLATSSTLVLNNNSTITLNGSISGSGVLSVTGNGTTAFNGLSGYGGTTLSGGTAIIGSNLALGGTVTIAGNETIAMGGNYTVFNSVALGTGTTTSFNTNGFTGTVAGSIAGAGDLVKTGSGTMVLSGTNTYTGSTVVNAGTVKLGSAGAISTLSAVNLAASGAALDLGSNNATVSSLTGVSGTTVTLGSNTLATNNSGTTTFAGSITGSGGYTKTGTGTQIFTGSNTYSGATNILQGAVQIQSSTGIPTTTGTGTLNVASGAAFELAGGITHTAGATITIAGTGVSGGGAIRNVSGSNTLSAVDTLTSGFIQLATNSSIVNAAGTGSFMIGQRIGNASTGTDTYIGLNGNTLTISNTSPTSTIAIESRIGNVAGTDTGSVVINGGTVIMQGRQNEYIGTTSVIDGTLIVDTYINTGYNTHGIRGDLVIGDSTGSAGSAVVKFGTNDNDLLGHTINVTINSDGLLNLISSTTASIGYNETVGNITLNGGNITAGNGTIYTTGNITYSANAAHAASEISGNLNITRSSPITFNVADDATNAVDLTVSAIITIGNPGTDLVKSGSGTLAFTADNHLTGYNSKTTINEGILNIQNGGALGTDLNGALSAGTVVNSGGTLQLQGGITITAEGLWLNGNGMTVSGQTIGALNNLSGNNTYNGLISLSSSSTINSSNSSNLLTIGTGGIAGTASTGSTQIVTFDGAGNTVVTGAIVNSDPLAQTGGTVALTKTGSGTTTISGANTFTGNVTVSQGTLVLGANNTLGAQTNKVILAGTGGTLQAATGTNTISSLTGGNGTATASTLAIASGATIVVKNSTTDTYSGLITGADVTSKLVFDPTTTGANIVLTDKINFGGTLELNGSTSYTTSLEFVNSASGSFIQQLTIGGGSAADPTILKLTNTTINVGDLYITGNTILDFDNSAASILNASNVYISAGVSVTVIGWNHFTDYWFATNSFRQDNSSGTIAINDQIGSQPENQVTFSGFNSNQTTWESYDVPTAQYPGGAFHQIRPIPEPSTYGALFLGASVGLFLWRRRKAKKA